MNSGRQVQLASSDAYDNVYRHRDGIQRAADLPEAVLGEALTAKASVFTDLSDEVFVQRLRSLAYKARTVEEETGANNLYVTLGTLVWNLEGRGAALAARSRARPSQGGQPTRGQLPPDS